MVQDVDALADRVSFIHQRFGQGAIIGNDDALQVLPITEMVFDKRGSKPEERIATQFARWDESYRERRRIRNVLARPIAKAVRERIVEVARYERA